MTVLLVFSRHAVDRYIERVRPGLDRAEAARELRRLAQGRDIRSEAPSWQFSDLAEGPFLYLGDDVTLPLVRDYRGRLVATTCLTRGWITPGERRARNRDAAGRRAWRTHHERRHRDPRNPDRVRVGVEDGW